MKIWESPLPIVVITGAGPWEEIPVVGEGAVFSDGRCAVAWLDEDRSFSTYATLQEMYDDARKRHWPEDGRGTVSVVTPDRSKALSLDPMHADAFVGTPGEGVFGDGSEPRRLLWLETDWCGNPVGVWHETPRLDVRFVPVESRLTLSMHEVPEKKK